MLKSFSVASVMICGLPRFLGGRLITSACDSVWSAIDVLPHQLRCCLTDELGNSGVIYGGFLQITDLRVLDCLGSEGLFACFRGVQDKRISYVDVCPPSHKYRAIEKELILLGWDIATGNGWLTASCHGCFPIDPFSGYSIDSNSDKINNYGLFFSLSECLRYCRKNNEQIPEHAPWFPVAVYVDADSYLRLNEYFKGMRLKAG